MVRALYIWLAASIALSEYMLHSGVQYDDGLFALFLYFAPWLWGAPLMPGYATLALLDVTINGAAERVLMYAISTVVFAAICETMHHLRRRYRRHCQAVSEINASDSSRCLRCCYDLTGLADGRPCPECGEAA